MDRPGRQYVVFPTFHRHIHKHGFYLGLPLMECGVHDLQTTHSQARRSGLSIVNYKRWTTLSYCRIGQTVSGDGVDLTKAKWNEANNKKKGWAPAEVHPFA